MGGGGVPETALIAVIRWVACAAVIITGVVLAPRNTSHTWPRLGMAITVAACPGCPCKEKTTRSGWFSLEMPVSPLGPRGDLDAPQRGATPGALVQGDSFDRNEMPLTGGGADERQDEGRARHRASVLGWRTVMVMLASPRSPRGRRQDCGKTSYHYHICCVLLEYGLTCRGVSYLSLLGCDGNRGGRGSAH